MDVCKCELSDTHPLYERYITLQMTLLDVDGPFNYSTLMQSAVNTLNQAAEEGAAYPSSLPLSPSLFSSLAITVSFSLRLCYYFICFTAFVSFFLFFYPVSGWTPRCYFCLKVMRTDTPQSLSYTVSKRRCYRLHPLLSFTACCPHLPATPLLITPYPGWP